MVGCLSALLVEVPRFQRILDCAFAARLPLLAIPSVLFASPLLSQRFGGAYQLTVGYTFEAIAIVLVLLWLVERPNTNLGRLLNQGLVVHVGLVSYSLYLWQELFTFEQAWWSVLGILIAAEASFWLIERPCLRLRDCVVRPRSQATARSIGEGHANVNIQVGGPT